MHKQDIAKNIAKKTNLDERGAAAMVNLVLAEISGALKKGKRVTLTGFGTFEIRRKKKRTLNSALVKQSIVIPAHKSVGFVSGGPLKELINK